MTNFIIINNISYCKKPLNVLGTYPPSKNVLRRLFPLRIVRRDQANIGMCLFSKQKIAKNSLYDFYMK
jgi:hypothetical protein